MASYNRLSEDVFMKAKALLNAGKTPLEVANFCGLARSTATRIKNTKSYADWLYDVSNRGSKAEEPTEGKQKITRTKITQNIYNAVKLIMKGGSGIKEAADVMGISVNSVRRIDKSESYVEYVNMAYMNGAVRYKTPKKQEEAPRAVEPTHPPVVEAAEEQQIPRKQTIIVQTTWQMTQEMRKTNELLELLNKKLSYIVDDLCGVKANAEPDH